jgi:ABC-type transport system substrate-binding protein
MKRKWIALIVACMLVVMLTACGGSGGSSDIGGASSGNAAGEGTATDGASAKDVLKIAVSQDSGTLDPINITGNGGFLNLAMTYAEPLVDFDASGDPVWMLATSFEPVSDTEDLVHIREGVTFSNGNPFTAEDVLFTLRLYADAPSHAPNVQALDVEKTNVVDEYTLDLHYTQYNAAQMKLLAAVLMLDAESYDPANTKNPIGTGPYVVTEYVVNSHVYVEARDGYWGDAPKIKNLEFIVINELSQVANALETGDIDVATTVPTADVDYINSLGEYKVDSRDTGWCITAFYNCSDTAPLASKEARYAIDYAINTPAIMSAVYSGMAAPTPWPASTALVDYEDRFANLHDTYVDTYNMEKAKQYAEESGLVGKTLTIVTNGESQYATVAQIIQNDLKTLGIESEIVNYDMASFYATMADPSVFDIAVYATATLSYMAADLFAAELMFMPCGWSGPDRDAFVALGNEVLGTQDEAARSDKLLEDTKTLEEFSPWYGICNTLTTSAYANDLQGYDQVTMAGYYYYQYLSFA